MYIYQTAICYMNNYAIVAIKVKLIITFLINLNALLRKGFVYKTVFIVELEYVQRIANRAIYIDTVKILNKINLIKIIEPGNYCTKGQIHKLNQM